MHEAKMHDQSSFVTLTYDEEHMPDGKSCGCRPRHAANSLCVDDCQLFLKRLRARLAPQKIRFFLCGEYGEKLGRPHYHAIIFGEDFSADRVPLSSELHDSKSFQLCDSALLSETWGKGQVRVGDVSFDSAAYVANYATKKIVGDKEKVNAHYEGRKPEFLLMSRRPGIGKSWFEKFDTDVFPSDEIVVRGRVGKPPRYYVQQIEARSAAEFPPGRWTDLLKVIKDEREKAAEALESEVRVKGVAQAVVLPESRNARRLEVRKAVAEAKASLKRRNLETNK